MLNLPACSAICSASAVRIGGDMLTESQIEAPNDTGRREKRADGSGLFLMVTPTGKRTWSLSYRFDGKVRTLPIGKYPSVSPSEARFKAEEARRLVDRGEDPGATTQRQAKERAKVARGRRFDVVAEEWFKNVIEPRREPQYAARVWKRVADDLLPELGEKDVGEIESADVLRALRKIEERGAIYSAKTIGRYASGIFRFAKIAHGLKFNPAEGIGDALRPTPEKEAQPSLRPDQVAHFYSILRRPHEDEEVTRLALELVMHTALRSAELRGGRWEEIKGPEWHVPASRMKMKRLHVVPLSTQARALLARLRALGTGKGLMFQGRRPGHPLTGNAILFAHYGLGFKGKASTHGWRATFSTWAHEEGRWPSEWIEFCLAHGDPDKVRASYNKATYLTQRREIMQAWSDWLQVQDGIGEIL